MPTDQSLSLALTPRDVALLAQVYHYAGCTADQLRRRFFPTPGGRSPCYARIARLVDAGYLVSTRIPSLSGLGSGKALLTLGPQARPILAEAVGVTRSQLDRARASVSPWLVNHHLAIGDFRLSLDLASAAAGINLDWTPERELKRSPIKVRDPQSRTELRLVPDGAGTLSLPGGSRQECAFEQDMGTLTRERLRLKLRAYLLQAREHLRPVLFVVPDADRLAAIAAWAQEEALRLAADPTIFWLTTRAQVTEVTILSAPIWRIVGGPDAAALLPQADQRPPALFPADQLVLAKGASA